MNEKIVKDGKITDEALGKFQRKLQEIERRVEQGTILGDEALDVMQYIIIEGKSSEHLAVIKGQAEIAYPQVKWTEKDGIIYFSLTSDGTTGEEWIAKLEAKGLRVSDNAKFLLRSKYFKPTNGVTYHIAVIKGELFTDGNRIIKVIRKDAKKRKFQTPNLEIACLIRYTFSDEEIKKLGLSWIVIMHNPVKDFGGVPRLLSASRSDDGHWLRACYGDPDDWWPRENGFAFVVSQIALGPLET